MKILEVATIAQDRIVRGSSRALQRQSKRFNFLDHPATSAATTSSNASRRIVFSKLLQEATKDCCFLQCGVGEYCLNSTQLVEKPRLSRSGHKKCLVS